MLTGRALRLYLVGSAALLAAYPLVPAATRAVLFLVAALGAVPAVAYGLVAVQPGRRLPWWLLLTALVVLNIALLVRIVDPDGEWLTEVLNAGGNLLILAAAMSLIFRCARTDVGGVIDASILGLAVGGVFALTVFGHTEAVAGVERANLFVVLFALSGVLGALVRLATTLVRPVAALRWLMLGLALALIASAVRAAAPGPPAEEVASVMFMAAYTSVGAFGLSPTAPRLVRPGFVNRHDRLTVQRLSLLGLAVATLPIAVGVLIVLEGTTVRDGVVLLVAGTVISGLVMVRIGRVAAERSHVERALRTEAAADPLTGLANRRTFLDRLTIALSQRRLCIVFFCDIDKFKSVNDVRGHPAGDELLSVVGSRLQSCVRDGDTVSRFGGDEFLILLVGPTPNEVDTIVSCIRAAFAEPLPLASGELRMGLSVGMGAGNTGRADAVIRSADANMYRAKRAQDRTPEVRVAR